MSRRGDRHRVAAAVVVAAVLLAWVGWDGTSLRPVAPTPSGAAACASDVGGAPGGSSEAFRLGGTVVRAETWCGAAEVLVAVAADVQEGGFMTLVAATSQGSATLDPTGSGAARLRVGPDGWLAVAMVQADARTLDGGGAWVTLTGGEAPR